MFFRSITRVDFVLYEIVREQL